MLSDLLDDIPDDDESEDDPEFTPDAVGANGGSFAPLRSSVSPLPSVVHRTDEADGDSAFGVPYDMVDSEDDEEQNDAAQYDDEKCPLKMLSDEIVFSHERFFCHVSRSCSVDQWRVAILRHTPAYSQA